MALHPDTLTAILNNWDAPKYDGSQDVRPWLMAIEELCRIYGIPWIQMTEMAVRSTAGNAYPVLTAMLETQVAGAGMWSWEDFKQSVIHIEDNFRQNLRPLRYIPHDDMDGDFPTEHPYATAALAVTLIGVGTAVLLPAVTVGIIGPGSVALCLQSAIYGGTAGGLFSALGATMVAVAGLGSTAAGTWIGFTSSMREDRPIVES